MQMVSEWAVATQGAQKSMNPSIYLSILEALKELVEIGRKALHLPMQDELPPLRLTP